MKPTTVAAGGVNVGVREWGDAGARPLLSWPRLNPFGGLHLIEAGPILASCGFRVLSIAPPGAGDTPSLAEPDDYLPTRLAQFVVDTAGALGVDRFAFMGWSWGASIGVHLAVRHPSRIEALVLLDAGHTDVELEQTRGELEREFAAEQERFEFGSWEEYFDAVRSRVPSWRPALEERYRAAMRDDGGRIVPRSSARAAAWALLGVAAERPSSTHERLGELGIPVLLVLAGRNDTSEEAERFQLAVPQADVRTVDAGHDLIADAPEETAGLVAGWLESALAGPG